MCRRARVVFLLALAAVVAPVTAMGQLVEVPATFGGDLWSRPRLTGDWLGFRDEMGKRGVTLDVDFLQVLQGTGTGGRDTGVSYGGTADYTLNADTGKLGLWPGGFLKVYAMSGYGTSENNDAGTVSFVNEAGLLPVPKGESTALMNLTFTQFLTKWFGVYVGKIYLLDADANDFAHNYRTQFLNFGLNINLSALLAPISAYGGGIVIIPWEGAVFTANVVDPNGTPTSNSLDNLFDDGVLVGSELRATVKPFGLVGHQLVGGLWSNKERFSIDQDPTNIARMLLRARFPRLNDPGRLLERILERFFPELLVPVQPLKTESETWEVHYNFDQYVWSPKSDPTKGVGIFFRFGASDGNPNPVKYFYSTGLSGNGIVPGRPSDTFGIGWSRMNLSDNFVPFLRKTLNLGLKQEDSVELYYNAAVTPWLGVTADLQIIDQGLKKMLSNGQLKDVSTAVVGGLRMYTRF